MTKKKLQNICLLFSILLLVLHPVLELDYLLDVPVRLSTIVNLILLPLLILLTFILFEQNRKRILTFCLCYGIPFAVYFVLHCKNANELQYNLYLTDNYVFLLKDEIVYCLILLIPLAMIYVYHREDIKEDLLEKCSYWTSLLTALPIFLGNVLGFGYSTYVGYTKDSFLSWFSLPFDKEINHPRFYASKFFFEEGNTIGVILLMTLPLLYYFFYKRKDKKRWFYVPLIMVHSLSMIMLSTRVATYCSVLVPLVLMIVLIALSLLKKESLSKSFLAVAAVMSLLFSCIIPFGPAYQNQQLDAMDYSYIIVNEGDRTDAKDSIKRGGEGLIAYSKEWFDYYTYIFQDYAFLIGVTPPVYYTKFYDYHHDPKFWVDFIFNYELAERVNGRQIENIFTHYKYDPLPAKEKILGMGYGTFMRGGIVIEQDFKMQWFLLGPLGFVFMCLPWLLVWGFMAFKILTGCKKGTWTFSNIVFMMSLTMAIGVSYLSGHVLDQLSSSLWMAFICGILLKRLIHEQA